MVFTDLQRLFLFGKLGGLNDKDAALAAGYRQCSREYEAADLEAASFGGIRPNQKPIRRS